ncbi:MAG TPA: helix-turn-helix domain-containing protein [Xanthobacteraceae bacterium]|nr:helix-turn-helix domain-containing protein [Xanthobacteraceae bacterium]
MLTQASLRTAQVRTAQVRTAQVRTAQVHTADVRRAVSTEPGAPPTARKLGDSIDMMGAPMSFARNEEIYGEREAAEYLYKVISGTVRIYKILADGRRQIQAFHVAGDVFGFEFENEHAFSAEAVSDARILVVKRSAVLALAARDNGVARQLLALTASELQRVQGHVMLLVKTAQERVVSFLLEMAGRTRGDSLELPMSRQDIADYLGLTIETVSRTLTSLESTAAIALPSSRRIVLRNQAALSRLAS